MPNLGVFFCVSLNKLLDIQVACDLKRHGIHVTLFNSLRASDAYSYMRR